jgi:hypothetical protein
VLMGLTAEVTMRTYHESSRAPTYVVREVYESGDSVGPAVLRAGNA